MESMEIKAEKFECSVNDLTGQERDGAVATADCTAEGRTVLKRKRPEHIYILCGGEKKMKEQRTRSLWRRR